MHYSENCAVRFALDVTTVPPKKVALKMMSDRRDWELELLSRQVAFKRQLSCVIPILGFHVPENSWGAGTDPLDRGNPLLPLLEAEKTRADDPVDANHSYIVVMPRAVQSLHDLITSQRIAGCDGDRVVDLFRGIVAFCFYPYISFQ